MANEHKSGLPNAFDRAEGKPEQQSVVFYGDRRFFQGAEFNEVQTIARGRHDRLSRLVAKDGDRVESAFAIVDGTTVTLTAGRIFVSGDVFPVAQSILTGVPMTGTITLGVKVTRTYITHEDDPTLVGLVPGSLAEGEPGAAREVVTIEWARSGTVVGGEYYAVYTLREGTILDQTPPPLLEGARQALAAYDRPHGHYIVSGCRVTALGADAGYQIFSVEQGEANINGFKNTRFASLRHAEIEDWDEAAVPGETHTYAGGPSQTTNFDAFPLASITSILLTKEYTATVTRGGVSGGADGLPDTSVIQLIEVKQGGTTYVDTTDYVRTGNTVDWAPGGAEPLAGSSYTVKYRYRASVTADSSTSTSFTVSGGATGGDIIVAYTYKMPRIDMLCLDQFGAPVYVKGISAAANPLAPVPPRDVLPLCQIKNDWMNTPVVTNDGVRSIPYQQMWQFFNKIYDHERLIQLERLKSGIDAREPVAKKGTFVDPFEDDTYRDAGEAQTAAVGDGVMQLAITPTFFLASLTAPVMLDYTEEIIATQTLKTACTKINPYANFNPLPGAIILTPAVDFWEESQTVWSSPATVQFNLGTLTVRQRSRTLVQGRSTSSSVTNVTSSSNDAVVDMREEQASFLREITVSFTISGFGAGEILDELTFDGIDVKPVGVITADGSGVITNTFDVPANVPVGTKSVVAIGAGGTEARGSFTGHGVVDITVMRRTTTIRRQTVTTIIEGSGGQQNGSSNPIDPQAQLFAVNEPRQIVGVDFYLCALGALTNHLLLDQVTVDNGYPTADIKAEAFVSMTGAVVGWKSGRYNLPLLTEADRYHAFVIKTDDALHSVSLAKLGGFDEDLQQFVSAHPYSVGPRFSSVNASSWTAHQDEALAFKLVAANYTTLTKTVALGSFAVVAASDLQVRAAVEIPSADCDVVFEIERTNGDIHRLRSHQVIRLSEFITETVELRAILTGTTKLSPVLFAPVVLVAGSIATTGTYITRAFNLGTAITLTSYIKAHLPSGSTMTMHYDKVDDTWVSLPLTATEALTDPLWVEEKHSATPITATQGRLKITITGGPAARPELCDLGAAVM